MAWADILDQELIKRVWQSHLATDRVASAYLLVGKEGIGKRLLAIEMAKALNCLAEPAEKRPCDECRSCRTIAEGKHPDVHLLLPGGNAEQIKIQDIRAVTARLALRPFNARKQVAIIVCAERLTEEAANSLLKSLEEPPAHARFLLTTSQLMHCLPTIVSRCQVLRAPGLSQASVRAIVAKQLDCAPQIADAAANLAQGSAVAALDIASRWEEYQRSIQRFNETGMRWLTEPLPETRQDVTALLDRMIGWLRDVAVTTACADTRFAVHTMHAESLERQAGSVDMDRCVQTAFELVWLRESVERYVSPRLAATLAREKWLALHEIGPSNG